MHYCKLRKYDYANYVVDFSTRIVESENFKIIKYTQKGITTSKLFIFDPTNKNLCRGYFWDIENHYYLCIGCNAQAQRIFAKLCQNQDGIEYLMLSKNQHVCDLREYNIDKYKSDIIVKKPLYEHIEHTVAGTVRKYLLIFIDKTKKLCYKFSYENGYQPICCRCSSKKLYIQAYVLNDGDGNEYVSIKDKKHICEPMKYKPSDYIDNQIINKPRYQVIKRHWKGKFVEKLVVFDLTDSSLCYEYTLQRSQKYKSFKCNECHHKHSVSVFARIINPEKENEHVELSKTLHKCTPAKFEDPNLSIVNFPNFKIIKSVKKGESKKAKDHLLIFSSTDKKLCYRYYDNVTTKTFTCLGCDYQRKQTSAKIYKNENGEDFVQLGECKHVCEPEPEKEVLKKISGKYNIIINKAKDITYGKKSKIDGTSYRCDKNFKKRCSSKHNLPVLSKIIEEPNFEILKYFQNGRSRKKLSIFPDSNDRKYCYEYFWQKSKNCYVCCSCLCNGKNLTAKIIKRNGTDNVQLNETEHVCNLREYKVVIEKENYEIRSYEHGGSVSKRIIIFLDSSQKFCYEYYRRTSEKYLCCGCNNNRHCVGAYICQKEDGTKFILSKSSNHVCEPRKFNPIKYGKKEIVEADNFKIFKEFQNGIYRSKLVIFTSPDQSMCYEYSWKNSGNKFICNRCHAKNKRVTSELCQNNDGTEYLKLNKAKHVCEPCVYDPDKFDQSKKELVESSNFKIFKYLHNGIQTSKLIIFCETNKNLCYEFHWNKNHQKYYCSFCPMENRPFATVCQNENSKDYLILCKSKHVCDLREFDSDKYKDDIIIDKSMYNLTSTTIGKVKNQILIIFTSQEKKGYHKFIYSRKMKYYYCSKCFSSSKIYFTATLQNEGKENEFVYVSSQKHMCDAFESTISVDSKASPFKFFKNVNKEYSSLNDNDIIMAPNFQFVKRKHNGNIIQHMVVFTNYEKSECYEYTWREKEKYFKCYTCENHHKIFVFAKIFNNDENDKCIELCEKPHKCKPIKFIPQNITAKIVKQPDFKLYETVWGKKTIKKLSIFDSKNPKMGYIYCYSENEKKYICHRCKNKKTSVTAKVLQDKNGENYLELNDKEHVCELQKI